MTCSAPIAIGVCAALLAPSNGLVFHSAVPHDRLPNQAIAGALPAQEPALLRAVFDAKTCTLQINGRSIKLYGKYQLVDSFPDFTVRQVERFADLKVQRVKRFPDKCGKWQEVQRFPDFKIKMVRNFPDLKVKYVDRFPGTRVAIPQR